MTARRRGEILQLKWKNIYNEKVFADKSTTKTNINDEYPLPKEVLHLLEKLDKKEELIFNMSKDRPTRVKGRMEDVSYFGSIISISSSSYSASKTIIIYPNNAPIIVP